MHYNRDYSRLEGAAKRQAALEDIRFYLGPEKFDEMSDMFKQYQPPITLDQFAFALSFAGIEGYPVRAWHEEIWGAPVLNERECLTPDQWEKDDA